MAEPVRASESAGRSVTETDSPSKAEVQRARRLLHQPGDRPAEGSEVQLRDSARRHREVHDPEPYALTPGRRSSFGCRYRLGTASNLVMYVSAADNDYVGVTGTFLGGLAGRLEHGAPGAPENCLAW